jgi:hypothetical protein
MTPILIVLNISSVSSGEVVQESTVDERVRQETGGAREGGRGIESSPGGPWACGIGARFTSSLLGLAKLRRGGRATVSNSPVMDNELATSFETCF